MTDLEKRKAAKEFSERWKDKGYEKGESQKFWIDLLENVLEVKNATEFIRFEDTVHIDKSTGFIDGFIDKTKVMIEQKSIDKDLKKAVKQSDGSLLNPFQQALRYANELNNDDRPRWIVTCNFKSFRVYDLNNRNSEPEEILLKDLPKEYYRLSFLVDVKNEHLKKEEELSFKAGELVGKLYDAFSKEYKDINNEQSSKDLNELCVRLVFCLYAEDAGLFGRKNVFHDYLAKYDDLTLMRENLIKLFKVLDTPNEKRDPYLEDELNQFPYVNGGLFSNENIEIPKFTEEIKQILLAKASDGFDWSEISPTIFGAVFESTLNPETRRKGGMHYTSIENIHKVIDPLFLNELREKLNDAESYKNEKTRNEKLNEFQEYISSLTFLDPACGSGNFLTETYLSLRRLENEALEIISNGMMRLDVGDLIKVSINQFYGIEINDFAVKVAKTALWIAESQMYIETKKLISNNTNIDDLLPLETYENIVEANALRIDWNDVVPNTKCNYIMGNPPFIGYKYQNQLQKDDLKSLGIFVKNLDYVSGWYYKSAYFIQKCNTKCAFVSTNSITQGEQVVAIWKKLFDVYNIKIIFAHRSFKWTSEASSTAGVTCVIIGFSNLSTPIEKKYIYDNDKNIIVSNINPYLTDADNIFIDRRTISICPSQIMQSGSEARDGGYLILSPSEKKQIIDETPEAKEYILRYINANDLINNVEKYCLWFKNKSLNIINKSHIIRKRLIGCKNYRIESKQVQAHEMANYPYLFVSERQPKNKYLAIPSVSSENRRYIPMDFVSPNVIISNSCLTIDNATLYTFGILTSNVHMAWMRTVAGRLETRYSYHNTIVYNNFPWPNPTKEQKEKIERTAQGILDARNKYPNSSLADLYDELTMPVELRKAHQENDKAVMEAYGFDWRHMTESDCVAELMKMYQKLVENKE